MSVRAYRVITKELADVSSFNLWHDEKLLDFFQENGKDGQYTEFISDGGSGTIEVSVKLLEKALAEVKWEKEDYHIEAIKADMAFAKKVGDDYVLYECY